MSYMTNASSASLVDTNILVYVYDPRDRRKQAVAVRVVDQLIQAGTASLSVQCLSEFYSAVTRKLPERLSPAVALERVTHLSQVCRVFDLTPAVVLEGCRAAGTHRLSIWDALIWATAKLNQVPYILTEDLQHGLFLEGVRIQDPFSPEFNLAGL
jgi:predicted nucleic acid-binding protein